MNAVPAFPRVGAWWNLSGGSNESAAFNFYCECTTSGGVAFLRSGHRISFASPAHKIHHAFVHAEII